jgi:hypothetical protein
VTLTQAAAARGRDQSDQADQRRATQVTPRAVHEEWMSTRAEILTAWAHFSSRARAAAAWAPSGNRRT